MSILPGTSGMTVTTVIEMESYPSMTYFLDKQSMQLRSQVDGLAAVVQAVEIILSVERFQWQIYDTNFGVEFNGLIGQDYAFVTAMLERRVKEALLHDDRVQRVTNFDFKYSEDYGTMTVTFDVISVFGAFATTVEVAA